MNTELFQLEVVTGSSNIDAWTWRPLGDVAAALGVLQVRFANGAVWNYYDVPESVWDDLQAAPSAGKAFAAFVRGQYNDQQVALAGAQPLPDDVEPVSDDD